MDGIDLFVDCPSCGVKHGLGRQVTPNPPEQKPVLTGNVKFWRGTKGWGAITSPDLPHDVWAHFSTIEATGYRALHEGDLVEFVYEDCWGHQDSWHYRATWVKALAGQ
jgi:cold shock protein